MKISKNKSSALTADLLRELLSLDTRSYVFYWKVSKGKCKAGESAGTLASNGYLYIHINYRKYLAHRLVWLYVYGKWPLGELDHRNLDKSDNHIDNLREADASKNQRNISVRPSKKSPWPKGVSFEKKRKKFRAGIKVNGKSINLGYHDSSSKAHAAYAKASRKHFGEFARSA